MSNIQATVDRVHWGHAAIEYAGGQRSSFEYGAAGKRDDAAVPMGLLQQKRAPPQQLKDVSHMLAGMVRRDQLQHRPNQKLAGLRRRLRAVLQAYVLQVVVAKPA